VVSKTTYFVHKKYRDPLSQFSEQFRKFLNQHPIVVPISRPSGHLTKHSKGAYNTKSGPRDDRATQVVGAVDRDTVEVSVVSH
jgi:hypothetical protein